MARVQSQQIIEALGQMSDLNGRTNELLEIIQRQQEANTGAISQMQSAATLIGTLMQGRQDMQDIMNAVQGHGVDMNASVERIREALNRQPTVEAMQAAIQNLRDAQNQALQGGLPAPAQATVGLDPNAAAFRPGTGRSVGGYNWRSLAKKSNAKTIKHKGGYNWRSSEKKKKTMTKKRNKKGHSSKRSSKRSSNKVS